MPAFSSVHHAPRPEMATVSVVAECVLLPALVVSSAAADDRRDETRLVTHLMSM